MTTPKTFGFDTLTLHAGQQPDPATGARATPIYQTASYVFKSADHAAALFNVERAGHVYSRITNPTTAVLEERIAALEGGVGAIATASGQAACHLAIATLMGAGSHIVSSGSIYGGTHNLLDYTLRRFGIETTFVDPRNPDAFAAAIRPETRLLFGETLGNPGLEVLNIPVLAEVAHQHGLPLLIDSTFTTPYLCRPFDLGADIIFHSATKFLSGHGVVIGGLLVDSGTFDWEASGKFPTMTEPYAGFHNMNFAVEFGPAAFITRARKEGARDFGACMSPDYGIPGASRDGDPATSYATTCRKHAADRQVSVTARCRGVGQLSRIARPSGSRISQGHFAARLRRRFQLQYRRAGGLQGSVSLKMSSCCHILPMLVMPNHW